MDLNKTKRLKTEIANMSAKKIINEAAKVYGLQSSLKHLFTIHPTLEMMSMKLASFIGMTAIARDGKPLLSNALNSALHEYNQAIERGADEDQAMPFYIRSLLNSGTQVFNQNVLIDTSHGTIMWQPFVVGLADFLRANPNSAPKVSFKESAIKNSVATAFVSMWLVPPELLESQAWTVILNEIGD